MDRVLGNREVESTALAGSRLNPDLTSMQFNNFLTMRQANTRSFIIGPVMQSLKDDKDPVLVTGINPNAVILNGEFPIAVPELAPQHGSKEVHCAF